LFVHMAIHRPRPEARDKLIDSMHRFGAAMQGCKGLQQAHALQDEESGALIGLAIWDSKEDWEAARPTMLKAIKDDPFDEWEDHPPEVFRLREV